MADEENESRRTVIEAEVVEENSDRGRRGVSEPHESIKDDGIVTEGQPHHVIQQRLKLDQLKAIKDRLLSDLLNQLSPQPTQRSLPRVAIPSTPPKLTNLSHTVSPVSPPPPRHQSDEITPDKIAAVSSPAESILYNSPRLPLPHSPPVGSPSSSLYRHTHISTPPLVPRSVWAEENQQRFTLTHTERVPGLMAGGCSPLKPAQKGSNNLSESPINLPPARLLASPNHSVKDAISTGFSSSHSPLASGPDYSRQQLMDENFCLREKCKELESTLRQSNMVNRALEAQIEKQKEYWFEWQSQAETYSHTISVLQDKLEASWTQQKEQDGMIEQLQSDLQMSVGEIQFWRLQQKQETTKYTQLAKEMKEMERTNQKLEFTEKSLKEDLSSAHRELDRLEAALRESSTEEQTLRSTICKLESQVRDLEHVNNRLHGQTTHYSLGRTPFTSSQDDGGKLWHPSPSSPRTPPRSALSTPPPPPLTSSHTHSAKHSPLNKRKWLEPSDPGLIFGTPHTLSLSPHYHQDHTQNQRSHTHQHTADKTISSSPLLQSTGQAIARQLSDSSNEGEDPGSLTGQQYINERSQRRRDSYGEKEKDFVLVDSTLSAIQRGRIRTENDEISRKKVEKESVEERVKRGLRVVAEAEEKLSELMKEKEQLEFQLQRTPRQGGRITRHSKQAQLEMEERLEVVVKEIGSVKMTLRSHHAFNK